MSPDNTKEETIQEKVLKEIGNDPRDYTAERDAKVMPLVKELFSTLGTHEFHFNREQTAEYAALEREGFTSWVRGKFMPAAMHRGIKVNELNYTFQMLNLAVAMLKSRADTPDNENDPRLTACAQAIFCQLADQETLLLAFHDDELSGDQAGASTRRADLYTRLYNEVVFPTFRQYEIKYNEMAFVFNLLGTIIQTAEEKVDREVEAARKVAEAGMWGIADIDDLDLLTIHKKVVENSATENPVPRVY